MNILVVDDEYYIVKNIIETTDWSALGIEQAFPAYSASQAKRIFEGSQDIDILLTDIEMPRETGLQLVEWLHENNFHPIVLVLTGHQRFDYAQEALNLHIFSYLLKPIDPDQLMEKLAAAVQEVKKNAWYEKERLIWKSISPPTPQTRSASSRTISVRIFPILNWAAPPSPRKST